MESAHNQENTKGSVLEFYKKLVALRTKSKYSPVIIDGEFVPYYTEDVSLYIREIKDERFLLVVQEILKYGAVQTHGIEPNQNTDYWDRRVEYS